MTKAELKELALNLGFDHVGVCDAQPAPHLDAYQRWLAKGYHGSMEYLQNQLELKQHPQSLLPGVQSIIAVALNYNQPNPYEPGMARVARYAQGRDYHKVLRGKLKRLGGEIELAMPGVSTRPCVDSAPIFERDFAHMAGLGWFGKNTMLIDSKRGSWFFLGLLLTTAYFEPDLPSVGGCGTCTRCVDACPTGAIVFEDNRWQVNGSRCISYLTIEHEGEIDPELESKIGEWTFGCDVCQEVCPFNSERESQPERARVTTEPDFLKRREWGSLERLAVIQPDEWDLLTQGSPVRRTGMNGLIRNVRINLKNQADS